MGDSHRTGPHLAVEVSQAHFFPVGAVPLMLTFPLQTALVGDKHCGSMNGSESVSRFIGNTTGKGATRYGNG